MTFDTLIEKAPETVKALVEGLKTLRERPDFHPEESAYEHIKIVTNRLIQTGNPDLIMSGIFHDIFKKVTAKLNPKNGYPTSPGHDYLAHKSIMEWLKDDNNEIIAYIKSIGADPERVALMCKHHMRIKVIGEMRQAKQEAFRQMEIFRDLQIFDRADNMLTDFRL